MVPEPRLHLWESSITIYHDTRVIPSPEELRDSPATSFWEELLATFPDITLKPIGARPRSPHMDKLRQKLVALSKSNSNEIVGRDVMDFVKE